MASMKRKMKRQAERNMIRRVNDRFLVVDYHERKRQEAQDAADAAAAHLNNV